MRTMTKKADIWGIFMGNMFNKDDDKGLSILTQLPTSSPPENGSVSSFLSAPSTSLIAFGTSASRTDLYLAPE